MARETKHRIRDYATFYMSVLTLACVVTAMTARTATPEEVTVWFDIAPGLYVQE